MLPENKCHNPRLLTQPSLRRIITLLRWIKGSNASPLQLLAFSPTIFSLQPYVRVHLTNFKLKFHILLWREALSGAQPEDKIQKKNMGKLSPQLLLFGQKFQKVENDENRFFAITSSKLFKN